MNKSRIVDDVKFFGYSILAGMAISAVCRQSERIGWRNCADRIEAGIISGKVIRFPSGRKIGFIQDEEES